MGSIEATAGGASGPTIRLEVGALQALNDDDAGRQEVVAVHHRRAAFGAAARNKFAFVNLPNATYLLAPMSGHAVITYSACGEQIGQEFIADPLAPPNTAWLAGLAPQWVLPPA